MGGDRIYRGSQLNVSLDHGPDAVVGRMIELGYEDSPGLQRLARHAVQCAVEEERLREQHLSRRAEASSLVLRVLQARGVHEPVLALQLKRADKGWLLQAAFFPDLFPS